MNIPIPTPMLPGDHRRELTPDEAFEVDLVLEAAADWDAGLLPASEAAKVGAMTRGTRPSPAFTRFWAMQVASRSDPRRDALSRLQDALDTRRGLAITPTGTLTPSDISDIHTARDLVGRLAS